jgi:hypothetical protein
VVKVSPPEDEATLALVERLAQEVLEGDEKAEVLMLVKNFNNPLYRSVSLLFFSF